MIQTLKSAVYGSNHMVMQPIHASIKRGVKNPPEKSILPHLLWQNLH
ncbi:hypothetical protein ACMHYJ_06375 [Castellaniella hirudinis]